MEKLITLLISSLCGLGGGFLAASLMALLVLAIVRVISWCNSPGWIWPLYVLGMILIPVAGIVGFWVTARTVGCWFNSPRKEQK